MTDRTRAIAIVAMVAFLALALWATLTTAAQCHAVGGTVVRGLAWLECIQ